MNPRELILVLIAVGVPGCALLAAEVVARTVNDPGPTATVAMVPLDDVAETPRAETGP